MNVIGGVHAGLNWQWRALIVGLEADIDAAGFKIQGMDRHPYCRPRTRLGCGESFSAMDEVH